MSRALSYWNIEMSILKNPDKLRTNSGLSRASASASVSIGKKDTIQEERMFSKKEGKFTVGSVS